jgi:hypothetical protein
VNALNVIEAAHRELVMVNRSGDQLELTALFPKRPIPKQLIETCREHKPELLELLSYQEQADALLLESTRRLAKAWPPACPLDDPGWDWHEKALNDAYWSQDLDCLRRIIEAREQYALRVFAVHRNEVRNV